MRQPVQQTKSLTPTYNNEWKLNETNYVPTASILGVSRLSPENVNKSGCRNFVWRWTRSIRPGIQSVIQHCQKPLNSDCENCSVFWNLGQSIRNTNSCISTMLLSQTARIRTRMMNEMLMLLRLRRPNPCKVTAWPADLDARKLRAWRVKIKLAFLLLGRVSSSLLRHASCGTRTGNACAVIE
jgi:hypothetical protein